MFIPDDIYREILKYSIIATVDILLVNANLQLLLGYRNNKPLQGIYYIPGGRVYKYEHILDAAKRKMKEELGLDIDIKKLQFVGVYDDIFTNESAFEGIGTHCMPRTYMYKLDKDEEKQLKLGDSQHNDLKFFDMSDVSLHSAIGIRINDLKRLGYI